MSDLLRSSSWLEQGLKHGFSLRTGGISAPPFDSLNLAQNVGDLADNVAENQRRFATLVGHDAERLYTASQVHGARVLTVSHETPESLRLGEADALITDVPGTALGVRVADCVAILLHTQGGRVVGAVHAGWRGTVANIVGSAVAALARLAGNDAEEVHALICPHIGVDAFQVGPEVVEAMSRALPGVHGLVQRGAGRPHVHLGRAVHAQLRAAGLPGEQIETLAGCTFSEPERYFSFRRDGKAAGRHLAVIMSGC